MKAEKLYQAIGDINDTYLAESDELAVGKSSLLHKTSVRKNLRKQIIAAAACLALLIGGISVWRFSARKPQNEYAVAELAEAETSTTTEETTAQEMETAYSGKAAMLVRAVLPDTVHTAVTETAEEMSVADQESAAAKSMDLTEAFTAPSVAEELAPVDGKNHIWSPLNLTMALAMLSECTDGETRGQIVKAMSDNASLEDIRQAADGLLEFAYYDNTDGTSLPANSIWLRDEGKQYNEDTLNLLARQYSASSFAGDMGSDAYNAMLKGWLNEQTHDLLANEVDDLSLDSETWIALASTIYYHADWLTAFEEYQIREETFHAPSGDRSVPMLHTEFPGQYFRGDHFGAVSLTLKDGNLFWLLLPDEGYTVQDVWKDEKTQRVLRMDPDLGEPEQMEIYMQFPKFDIVSEMDLAQTLPAMGITDVLDPGIANFSPLSLQDTNAALTRMEHAARISVDEWGITAAAYTVERIEGATESTGGHLDFICDRPFVFAITDTNRITFFEGVVNEP